MSMLPGFALPEDLLCVSQDAEAGLPIDAITCALDRADSVLMLLEDHLDGDKPLLPRCQGSCRVLRFLKVFRGRQEYGHAFLLRRTQSCAVENDASASEPFSVGGRAP